MNASNDNWIELSRFVWSQQESRVGYDFTGLYGTSDNNTNTRNLIDTINQELNGICLRSEVSRNPYSGL